MRILKNVLIVAIVTLFISCTASDDTIMIDANAKSSDLAGTWNLTEESQDGKITMELVPGIPTSGNITSVGKNLDTQITFTENPNFLTATGEFTDAVKVSVLGKVVAEGDLPIRITDLINQGTWSLNEGVITLTQKNIQETINITQLTSTTLKIEIDIKKEGVTYLEYTGDIDTTVKMTFTKL